MSDEQITSAAWRQFLLAKRAMLAEYDRALSHARTQPVVVHHGDVGEAAVRNWLIAFLPKRYGVTAGYVRSQGVPDSFQSSHFDVIVYDQLEAPTLWTEENRDKSQAGRARIIPAEHVGAIIEVKSAFHRRSVGDGAAKLRELTPLMTAEDAVGERYPRFLPATATTLCWWRGIAMPLRLPPLSFCSPPNLVIEPVMMYRTPSALPILAILPWSGAARLLLEKSCSASTVSSFLRSITRKLPSSTSAFNDGRWLASGRREYFGNLRSAELGRW